MYSSMLSSSFVWSVNVKAGALTVILDHEVLLRLAAEGWYLRKMKVSSCDDRAIRTSSGVAAS